MHIKPLNTWVKLCCVALLLLCAPAAFAQSPLSTGNPASATGINNAPQRDTNLNKSNTNKWDQREATVTYEKLSTAKIFSPDTSLHTFHRRPFIQPWYRDLGNLGSPANNLMFTPDYRVGPTLGYHTFDIYRFNVDSLGFYHTNRPYSVFGYQLGSRLEQVASLFHTQNIRPNWNIAVDYRKTNSPGYYMLQRVNSDNANLTTNYKSLDKHYSLYAAMVYNKQQNDENGGIINEDDLLDPRFSDRRTISTPYEGAYSITRSAVSNVQRDFTGLLQHTYTWGRTDTTYNSDSTEYTYHLIPRFSITHKMEISTEKHTFNDLTPDSMRYTPFFDHSFLGANYYVPGTDSVHSAQKWFWVDNALLLNGYIGNVAHPLKFSAGAGVRYDQFVTTPTLNLIQDSLPKHVYTVGLDRSSYLSNYVTGELKKEALAPGQWEYLANTRIYLTGQYAGNLSLNASLGKNIKALEGNFVAGFSQQVNSAPYSYTIYGNAYTKLLYSFSNEIVNMVYASLESPALRVSGGVRNYLISNYIYINEQQQPSQYSPAFNVSQAWLRKLIKMGNFYLDNELVYQQSPTGAPVNIPALLGRHQLSFERDMFHRSIRIATGAEVRYNTAYDPAGYSALLNRFYYQSSKYVGNTPELSVFLNFRIKRFRAYVMGDMLQRIFTNKNTVLYTAPTFFLAGVPYTPVYAAQDAMIRFGFSWALIN